MYIVKVKPFETPRQNYMEAFNELCILGASYHLFLMSDFLPNVDIQYTVGWSLIGITTFNIAANMIVMLYQTASEVKKQVKVAILKVRRYLSRRNSA